MIFHLVAESDLRAQIGPDFYRPKDLSQIGFVHCAAWASVLPVANDYFAEVPEPVVVLELDPDRITAETRYEAAAPLPRAGTAHLDGAPEFPHVYGPIDVAAIRRVGVLVKGDTGFEWPDHFTALRSFLAHEVHTA